MSNIWKDCLQFLETDLPQNQFNTWIRPLQAVENEQGLTLLAPNQFVLDQINSQYLDSIRQSLTIACSDSPPVLQLLVGSVKNEQSSTAATDNSTKNNEKPAPHKSNLNHDFTFDSFVEGKSNQLARAASFQVSENPGTAYNPLFIYGGVGLGKTHLMHAVGNMIRHNNTATKVIYLHSERFVADMVKALQHNKMDEFKRYYRSFNAHFTNQAITLEFAREALRDLLALQDRLVSIENIKKTVAEYYKIRVHDILSARRTRSITRPRQIAMALSKELTHHSLPEIGDAFGGRDHTTVLHACRKVKELRESDVRLDEDYQSLLRILST